MPRSSHSSPQPGEHHEERWNLDASACRPVASRRAMPTGRSVYRDKPRSAVTSNCLTINNLPTKLVEPQSC